MTQEERLALIYRPFPVIRHACTARHGGVSVGWREGDRGCPMPIAQEVEEWGADDIEALGLYRNRSMTAIEIGWRLGVNERTVRNRRKALGIPTQRGTR